ncbi:hypothetical protein SOVF_013420 [Spinacia oleracea]|nr:hypothetical protein SOVF_013420 [Spinacia oleracea]
MPLNNLRGKLKIIFREGYSYNATNADEGSSLLSKKHIKALVIEEDEANYRIPIILDERLLEFLQPHHDLRLIKIFGYISIRLPDWAAAIAANLPLLVRICLKHFEGLQHLPQLSQLRHLKFLQLEGMPNVDYMEYDKGTIPFFPSLEELSLGKFPKLKGWWRLEVGEEREAVIPVFSRLHYLTIFNCPNLTYFPGIPHVKEVSLTKFNEALTFCKASPTPTDHASSSSDIGYDNKVGDEVISLNTLDIDNVGSVNYVFGESSESIRSLKLILSEVESLSSFAESYVRLALSIEKLEFKYCLNLKSLLGGGLEHMVNLQSLVIKECCNLELEEDEDGMPWKAFHKLIHFDL